MKRIVLMVLVVCICVGMCACSNNSQETLELTDKINAIELASIEDKWATVLELSEEILEKYPESSEAKTAQAYRNKAVQVFENSAYEYLRAGKLEDALVLLTRIKNYSEKAQALIPDVEEYNAIAGVYTATTIYKDNRECENPYREEYYLTVMPFLSKDGEWCAGYTIELPGVFYRISSDCFTHTCIGLLSNGKEPVISEINPQIDSYNKQYNDTFKLWKKDGGYYAEHFLYNEKIHQTITLTFTR